MLADIRQMRNAIAFDRLPITQLPSVVSVMAYIEAQTNGVSAVLRIFDPQQR